MFWIALAVFLIVLIFLAIAVIRARRKDAEPATDASWGEPFVVIAGVVLPSLILAFVFVISLRDMRALSAPSEDARLEIEVVGHDWWWEVRYPGSDAVTANEIHIPTGEPVRLELTAADVIHSFWVPQLQAKTDMIPGKVNYTWIEADAPGRYRGQCAEFCGLQHANMIVYVVAQPPAEFDEWLANEAQSASPPTDDAAAAGENVFMNTTCVGCHAIRGTAAVSQIGPDLTHLAQRETIAAGVLANTRANLARFVTEPHDVKPGVAMPPTALTPEELEALLDYLEQLD